MAKDSPIIPIAGGAAGAVIAVTAADKLGANPTWAAWGTAAAGAATALGTKGVVQKVAMGVGAAGVCLGAIQLISAAKASKAKKETAQQKRQADGEPFVTRSELNDAVTRLADLQKQGQRDLVTSLRDEIKKVVVETTSKPTARIYTFPQRGASSDDERNAVVEDEYMRNAYGDEERNAFAEDERNAFVEDEYMRNAYGDEERNARFGAADGGNRRVTYAQPVGVRTVPAEDGAEYDGAFDDQAAYYDDARNAYADVERNAYVDDERNAYVDEERNAYAEEAAAA